MVDIYIKDEAITEEEAEMRRAFQPGRINTPERKEARVRARLAAEKAAHEARNLGAVDLATSDRFVLSGNHAVARAAGLALPGNWLTRLVTRLWRWFRA
jgi:hypothetical protein